EDQLNDLKKMEQEKDYRRKAIFDYVYLLEKCVDTGAAWVAMIEDDTLAVAGWFSRAMRALDIADSKSTNWLYLRLFYTEEFLGWNSEEWPTYFLSSLFLTLAVAAFLVALQHLRFHVSISNTTIVTTCFVCLPAYILLYFLAGRLSMRPLSSGVHEMPKFGCCGQGFIFPTHAAARVVAMLRERKSGFVDMILEEWANKEKLTRFAIFPSLLQHIGGHSSKGDDFKRNQRLSVAERIFNFGFELYQQRDNHAVHPMD
ncbi:MAG: hypothetical protein Q9174_004915, partial [Haloplaca sp. 1 TL-2023]